MSDPLRFFVPADSLRGDEISISGDAYHHLHRVLRCKPGDEVLLLDGTGECCLVQLRQLQSRTATTRLIRRWRDPEQGLPITLLQALPKGDKFDLVLQKGTELGIRRFVPVQTAHVVPQPTADRREKRQQRWERIICEAARQSRRSVLPDLTGLQTLEEALAIEGDQLRLVLWEAGSMPLAAALPQQPPSGVQLLVGPEGGFSPAEMVQISAAGFRAVHLGPRILRTETAGLAAAPVLQYLYGDWTIPPQHGNPNQSEASQ